MDVIDSYVCYIFYLELASEPACIEELSLLAFVHFALLLMLGALPIPSGPQELALPEKEAYRIIYIYIFVRLVLYFHVLLNKAPSSRSQYYQVASEGCLNQKSRLLFSNWERRPRRKPNNFCSCFSRGCSSCHGNRYCTL